MGEMNSAFTTVEMLLWTWSIAETVESRAFKVGTEQLCSSQLCLGVVGTSSFDSCAPKGVFSTNLSTNYLPVKPKDSIDVPMVPKGGRYLYKCHKNPDIPRHATVYDIGWVQRSRLSTRRRTPKANTRFEVNIARYSTKWCQPFFPRAINPFSWVRPPHEAWGKKMTPSSIPAR